MLRCFLRIVTVFAVAIAIQFNVESCLGATVTWNGSAEDNSWDTATNWDSESVPSKNSEIIVGKDNSAPVNVVKDGVLSVGKLIIGQVSTSNTQNDNFVPQTVGLTVNGNFSASIVKIGQDGYGALTVKGDGTETSYANFGTGSTGDYLWISYATTDKSYVCKDESTKKTNSTCSVLDLSEVHDVTFNMNRIAIAARNNNTNDSLSGFHFDEGVTVLLGYNNTITTKTFEMASSYGQNLSALQTTVTFGAGINTLNIDNMTIGGMKADADDSFKSTGHLAGIKDGGTFILNGNSGVGSKANLYIANNAGTKDGKLGLDTFNTSIATLDLSNASKVEMNLGNLTIARHESTNNTKKEGSAIGTLKLGNNATVTADSVNMSIIKNLTDGTNNIVSTIELGGVSNIHVTDSVTMGNNQKSISNIKFSDGGVVQVDNSINVTGIANITATQTAKNSAIGAVTATKAVVINADSTFNVSGATVTTDSLTAASNSNISIINDGALIADSFTTSGTSKITIGTAGNQSDNSLMQINGTISNQGPTTFVLNSGTVQAEVIEVTIADGQTDPVFEFLGGKLIVDNFNVKSSDTKNNASAVNSLTTLQASSENVQVTADSSSLNTLHQNGVTAFLSPGDDGVCGKTLIKGNYVLDSGAITLDITTNGDQDTLEVHGSVTLSNSTDAQIIINLLKTEGNSEILNSAPLFSMMAAAESDSDLVLVTPAEQESTLDRIVLFSADSINIDGDIQEWANTHIVNLDGKYTAVIEQSGIDGAGQSFVLYGSGSPTIADVPEPATWLLLVLGAIGLFWLRNKHGYTGSI